MDTDTAEGVVVVEQPPDAGKHTPDAKEPFKASVLSLGRTRQLQAVPHAATHISTRSVHRGTLPVHLHAPATPPTPPNNARKAAGPVVRLTSYIQLESGSWTQTNKKNHSHTHLAGEFHERFADFSF